MVAISVAQSAAHQTNRESKKAKKFSNKQGKRQKLHMNVANCRYEVIRDVAKEQFHYKLIEEEQPPSGLQIPGIEEFDIYWSDTAPGPDRLLRLRPYQRMNHFPGMFILARKN